MLKEQFMSRAAALKDSGRLEIIRDADLSRFCTFRIGGPAEAAMWPLDADALASLLSSADEEGQRYTVCGAASNILFSDDGFCGAVIFTTRLKGISVSGTSIAAECGVPLSSLAVEARKAGLSGLEFAYGIPGTLGGAVYMNAGAYGGEMKDVVVSSDHYDPDTGSISSYHGEEHRFGYRESVYMSGKKTVLRAVMSLTSGDPDGIQAKMDANMAARREKQPLEYPSAGSAFKRAPGHYTAAMIDEAGLKGFSVGGAQVSEKHAGFIINRGGATAEDVRRLIDTIRSEITRRFGVDIEPEIRYVGP